MDRPVDFPLESGLSHMENFSFINKCASILHFMFPGDLPSTVNKVKNGAGKKKEQGVVFGS